MKKILLSTVAASFSRILRTTQIAQVGRRSRDNITAATRWPVA